MHNDKCTLRKSAIATLCLSMMNFTLTSTILLTFSIIAHGQDLRSIEKELLKAELNKLLKDDQKYRSLISYGCLEQEKVDSIKKLSREEQMKYLIYNKKQLNGKISDSLWTLQNKIDMENILSLEKIILTYGWPSDERLGEDISAEVLLFHTPTSKVTSMEIMLLEEVLAKRMAPNLYAMFVDNMRLKHGKNQLYGSNIEFSRESGKEMPPTIDDIVVTNKLRKEIGLIRLKEGEYRTR